MLLEISNSVKYLVIFILLFCRVLDSDGEEVELCSSVECKVDIFLPGYFFPIFIMIFVFLKTWSHFQGIIGSDGRHYILDLFRTFPPDVNFLGGKIVCLLLQL